MIRSQIHAKLCCLLIASAPLFLLSCADQGLADLDVFMAEKRAEPGGVIEPIPAFEAYEAFAYAAATLRSPFDRPVDIRQLTALSARAALGSSQLTAALIEAMGSGPGRAQIRCFRSQPVGEGVGVYNPNRSCKCMCLTAL